MSHSTLGEVGTYFGGSRDCGRDDEVLFPNSVMEELRFAQNSCVTLQNRATHLRSQVALGEPGGVPRRRCPSVWSQEIQYAEGR